MRYCLLDLSALSDLLTESSVIRCVIKLRGVCLESVFISQLMCLLWRFRICQMVLAM
ncbi:hypothetical protein ACSBR2_011746 [Camellia fascicularis]